MKPTVLVVDDDKKIRSFLARLLRSEGLEVVTACDGESALTEFSRVQPDLVLLDVMMPEPDGFAVCRQLKSDPDTMLTPIVLLTGLESTEERVRGIEAGVDEFLSKPFQREELLARVRSLLRVKSYTDELERAEAVVLTLARAIEGRDPCTEGHCERLSEYASRLAVKLRLPDDEIVALRRGGIVHDIGKVVVPDAILMKPHALTPDEMAVMRQHTGAGVRICSGLKSFKLVLPIIRSHHEKCDGSGYPEGLSGEEVPLTARVLQVVDVYDALTTERPYKPALSPGEALATMQQEVDRGWWDPVIYREFRELMVKAS